MSANAVEQKQNQDQLFEFLIKKAEETISAVKEERKKGFGSSKYLNFTGEKNVDKGLSDITNRPYLFVLGCVMDRQVKAEQSWKIPDKVCSHFDIKKFDDLARLTKSDVIKCFKDETLHRFNDIMGENFYDAVQRIKNVYHGDASEIWKGEPSSALVVYRFLCFKGVGIKIATMATNILQRDLGVKFSDKSAIDVSPDVHVRRILYRLGLTDNQEDIQQAVYMAKAINPSYPGIIDLLCWQIGRDYCDPDWKNKKCEDCPLNGCCEKKK